MNRLSKFDYGAFYSYYPDCRYFAASVQRFTKEEAEALFQQECGPVECYEVSTASVVWRAGVDEDNEPRVCWWLELDHDGSEPRHCPVWLFEY